MDSECQHSFTLRSFVEIVRQLYRLWPRLDGRDETVDRDMDDSLVPLVKAIQPIRIMDTDLNDTFGVDGAATVSLNLYRFSSETQLTCGTGPHPRRMPCQRPAYQAQQIDCEGDRHLR